MKYRADRGGHAPGHLRDALNEWIEMDQESDVITVDGEEKKLFWLLGQLMLLLICLLISY